jgi:acetylcholinesterase
MASAYQGSTDAGVLAEAAAAHDRSKQPTMAGASLDPPLMGPERPQRRPFSTKWLSKRLALIMVFMGTTVLLFWYSGQQYERIPLPSEPHQPGDEPLVVRLYGYGSFRGTRLATNLKKTKEFKSPVDAWLGVEYSTQPVGTGRFKPVSWPLAFEGTKDAMSSGPACWQNVYGAFEQSEACLTVNIYRPSDVSMQQKLPVLVFLHGGSFVMGSHGSFDGALFVEKSAQPLMVVTAQYRLGALGSLPGMFMDEKGLLNLGLRDQKMMLEFIHEYIQYFGGDAGKITLGGQSAGGHAVGIHLFHDYGEDTGTPLFQQAILASGSPTARAFPGVDYPLYQRQVEHFMDYVNCPSSPSAAALECLQFAEIDDIQFISSSLYNAHNYNITWPWQPVSPGPLLEKQGSVSGKAGTFFKLPTLISSTTDEGKAFAPQNLRTNQDFLDFWKNLVPGLTTQDLDDLEKLYPDPQSLNGEGVATYISAQFERIAAAYGDYSYICPVQDTASRLSLAGAPVYKARFNTPNYAPAFMGVPHASDSAYFNGKEDAEFPEIAESYTAYWASFVVSGDPITFKKQGSAEWERYDVAEGKEGRQMVVNRPSEGGPKMEDEVEGVRKEQCAWWRDEGRAARLNK